ncbi:MAG TPA: tRNA uridine-5-carboxymethylaminomethyl(34) synthesis enzyme MnmG [Acholeplasmatales bacterium]|nr:tRNA uridine-5-carboxymethylaminomethyl(34) synthesis enzyme MnmG [Acholeplasmatales bacterium]
MYDAIVIGGGHAGSEATLALARLHQKTLLVTGNRKMIATMPCNPSIGGPAKGTIVREIDALGGEMGKIADFTSLQMKMLNHSKGPAVRALRAQSDKVAYPAAMQAVLFAEKNVTVEEAYVVRLIVEAGKIAGVILENGEERRANAVVLTAGTYMEGAVLVGSTSTPSGPDGQRASVGLSAHLRELGIETFRLKTGTPQRIRRDSIDFSKMEPAPGDDFNYRFSFTDSPFVHPEHEWPCYLIHTTEKTRSVIQFNLRKSAMYSGLVKGVGPRYCPSIEDKYVRFADKERHQLFIEPESASLDVVYLQGFSTSMPHDVQDLMVRSLPGLEHAVIAKYAYAIEYDAIHATDLWPTLESKQIPGLYFAGQVNGTSGYEEAAAQGLMAGINAAHKLTGKEPFLLRRDEAYIGVLIDDLVTKGVLDPYRMLTSRAEFRLLLRHDNADQRLTPYGHRLGLVSDAQYARFNAKCAAIKAETDLLARETVLPTPAVNARLAAKGSGCLKEKQTLRDLLKRPELGYADVMEIAGKDPRVGREEAEQIEIEVTYEGYIEKAVKEAAKLAKEESIAIPADFDYDLHNLALEARVKLKKIRPLTLGQAARISGVNPADVQALAIRLKNPR